MVDLSVLHYCTLCLKSSFCALKSSIPASSVDMEEKLLTRNRIVPLGPAYEVFQEEKNQVE